MTGFGPSSGPSQAAASQTARYNRSLLVSANEPLHPRPLLLEIDQAMKPLRMQPTFRVEVAGPVADTIARLRNAMLCSDLGTHADAAGSCFDFRVAPAERRLWSPHLSVQLSPTDDGGVELFGRFSPRPEVWTLVMMLYFAGGFVVLCGAIYGCVQAMLGTAPWALIAIPVGAGAIVGLHLVSLAGQRLSADQMEQLRERLDRVMAEAFGTRSVSERMPSGDD